MPVSSHSCCDIQRCNVATVPHERSCGVWHGMPTAVDYSVPYYTLHKIMAGLLDQALLAHNADAYALVLGLADWTVARVAQTLTVRGGCDEPLYCRPTPELSVY